MQQQQQHEEEQPPQWARGAQQVGQRPLAEEQQHVQPQQVQGAHLPLPERCLPEQQQQRRQADTHPQPQLPQAPKLAPSHPPHLVAEDEGRQQTATAQKEGPFLAPTAARRRLHTHSDAASEPAAPASVQPQQAPPQHGAAKPVGVDCHVPSILSAISATSQKQPPPAGSLGSTASAASPSSPGASSVRERHAHFRSTNVAEGGAPGEGKEDEENNSHSTRRPSHNSSCQRVGGVRREEGRGGAESAGDAATHSRRSDTQGLHVAEAALGLHLPEEAFADAAAQSSSFAASQSGPSVGAAPAPAYQWQRRLGDDVATGNGHDSAGLPVLSSSFYSNVFSSEATSESAGSFTSPAASPPAASSPYAASPSLTASPASGPSARGSRSPSASCAASSADVRRASLSTAHDNSSGPGVSQTQEHAAAEEPCSTSVPPTSFVYDKTRARTRGRTASYQQGKTRGNSQAEKKPRSSSTGGSRGSHSNYTSDGYFFSMNSPRQSSSACSARGYSAAVSSPSAAAFSTSASSSSSRSAATFPDPSSSAAVCHSTAASPSDSASRVEAVSSAALTPAAAARGSFTATSPHRSSWGRQLNGPGDAVEIVVDKCIYRQQNVKRPEQSPVLVPNGEPLPGLRVLYNSENQLQRTHLSPAAAFDWHGPMALPYNAEEVPPSPFSKGTGSQSGSRGCTSVRLSESGGLPQVPHRRGSAAAALAAMRIPTLFSPPHHSSAKLPRSACNAVLNHADFSPPSPFFSVASRSSAEDAPGTAAQHPLPYPQVAVRTCAVHQQLHTFVYPFTVDGVATESAAAPSTSTSLFYAGPQPAAAEPQKPVLTYCISNNGMGEALPYSSRGAAAKKTSTGSPWLRWLWPWRKQHALSSKALQQHHQQGGGSSYDMQDLALSLKIAPAVSSIVPSSSPSRPAVGHPSPSSAEGGGSANSGRKWRGFTKSSFPFVRKSSAAASPSAHRRPPAARMVPAPHGSSSISSCEEADGWRSRGRGTFVLAAVSAALEIGCVWRFPSYCFKFGGATFLLAYVVLLLVLGVPVLALEMALGQVFRGGQMKVLNLISPRLRGLAAATLLLSFFICAYYSIFISWTLQFLFSSIRPSLPWSITSQEAAICAAAGHDAAACSRATLPTPFSATQGVVQQQLMESYMGDQQQQQLGKQKQLQQALRRLNAHRAEGGKKKKGGRQNKEMQQSFCAWQKPADGNSAGVCVADDKLKARTFLYTDVAGLWVKTTERLSSVPGVFFRAAADDHKPPAVDPSTGGGGTAPSVADTFPATGDDAGLAEEGAAAVVSSSSARGESSPLPERAQQKLRSSGFSARRLAPHAAAADTSFSVDGASPRVTSVAVAASLWNLTPLVAVGLAAVWMQIYLFSLRGYKPTTTFTYVTAVTPILAMLLIAGLALSLDGASLGLRHLFSPSPHVFSSPSSSTNDPARAAARKLDGHFMAHDTSASAVRSAGALARRISDGGALPEGVSGERAHTAASAGGKAAGYAALEYAPSAAAAPAPLLATTARGASQKAVAAPVTQLPRENSTNSSGSDDFLSFIFPFWPQWLTAGSHTMWGEAAAQVFFSLGVFQGVVTAYASHKHLTENVLLDAAAAAVTNLGMSLLAAIATFAVAGHVAKRLGAVDTGTRAADLSALQDVQGSQLVFVLYPLAFASLPRGVAQVTCILCFLALLLLGLTSVVGLVQPVLGLLRRCLWMEKYPRWKIAGAVCAVGLLIGLPFCARGGLLLVEAADYRWTVVGLVFIGCCESIAFGWLYGVGRQAQCIGYLPLLLHGVTYWLAVLLAAVLLFLSPPPHNAPATAFAVSISVAAVGAAAALWCCPWEGWRRKKQRLPAMQQSHQDGQKETKKQEQVVVEPRQQQAQQQPAKRKGKPQTGMAEKSRVKFTNGCADSSSGTGAATAVVGSSSSTQRLSNHSNAQDVEEDHQNQSCSTRTNNTRHTGNGHTSSYGAAPASPPGGSIAHSSRQGSGITVSHSSDSRTDRTGRQVNEVNGRNACSNSSSAAEEPSAERSHGKRSSDPDAPSRLPQSGSSSVGPASGSSSSGTKKPAVTGNPSSGVESNVTGAANCDDNVLDGRDSSEVGESSDAVPVSGSGTSDASVANSSSSSSSSGNDAHGRRRQRGDPGVVLDTPKVSGAGKSSPKQQQQQTRYRSPRSRSSRRRREGRGFVFIKRDGETLPFLSCVFWLFVGNVEHLRKNLNAITCSGYRVLRLWPPWSIVIRYVIPTILMLLVVQELPQLFVTISRYTQPPPAGAVGSSRGAGIAAAIAQPGLHTELQQRPAAAQEHYVQLRHSRPEEEKEQQQQARQNPQMLQQQLEEEEEKLKYRSVTPAAAGASWRSLVTIQVFTLGALLLVVGLVILGLLLPHAWDVFIPKERRRHGLNVTSAGASSFRSLSSRGSPSCPAADNMGTARVADVLGPHQQRQEP